MTDDRGTSAPLSAQCTWNTDGVTTLGNAEVPEKHNVHHLLCSRHDMHHSPCLYIPSRNEEGPSIPQREGQRGRERWIGHLSPVSSFRFSSADFLPASVQIP